MTADAECRITDATSPPRKWPCCARSPPPTPPPNRHALSREFCRRIGWLKPDGGLKDMMARVTMLAMHKDGLIVLPTRNGRALRVGRWSSDPTPSRRRIRRRHPSTRFARSICGLPSATAARASCGTSSSPATTISARRPWSAPRCATPSTTATAGPSPCSASAPPRGSSHPATVSSDGHRNCGKRTCPE